MPSPYEAALMSRLCYEYNDAIQRHHREPQLDSNYRHLMFPDGTMDLRFLFWMVMPTLTRNSADFLHGKGWYFSSSHDSTEEHGYFSLVFINDQTKEIVIAHRGTTLDIDMSSQRNCADDIELLKGENGNIPKILDAAVPCIVDVVRKRDKLYKSYTIHQTGHSLGGFVAEFGAAYVANPNPKFPKLPANMDSYDHHFRLHTPRPKDANAITFDSLGSVNILRKLGISELQAHTVNYLPKASIVNTANPHDGLRYLLTDVITTNSSASVTFSFVAETAKNLREIIDSKDSHSIDYIISLFSQETEYPNFSVCVSGWPAAINVFLTAPTPIVPKVPVMNPPNNILNILQNVGTGLFFIGTVAAAEVVHGMTGIVQFEHTRTGSIVPINGNKAPSPILTSYGMSGRATGRTHMTTNVVNPVKISNNTQ